MFGADDNDKQDSSSQPSSSAFSGVGSTYTPPSPQANASPLSTGSQNLDDIKKQAVSSLAPIATKLDQSPEDKFKTLMMLIQASSNQDLIPAVYEAAKQIENDQTRAQALLDVINEINYLALHSKSA